MQCAHSQFSKQFYTYLYIFIITEMILNTYYSLLLLRVHDFQLNFVYLVVFIVAYSFLHYSLTCGSSVCCLISMNEIFEFLKY